MKNKIERFIDDYLDTLLEQKEYLKKTFTEVKIGLNNPICFDNPYTFILCCDGCEGASIEVNHICRDPAWKGNKLTEFMLLKLEDKLRERTPCPHKVIIVSNVKANSPLHKILPNLSYNPDVTHYRKHVC
ncbi:MAG: hypothetical protein LBK60_11355 [Verrucomicrobiales bacterium]|nr:hypothetical protein [Verrucomicrobiales bacterium]